MLKTLKILEVKPKLKSDGSKITSSKTGSTLKLIKAVGVNGELETWDDIQPETEVEVDITKQVKEYNGQTFTSYVASLPKRGGSGYRGRPEEPNKHVTMLISYAKDMAVAEGLSMGAVEDYSRKLMALYRELIGEVKASGPSVEAISAPRPEPKPEPKQEPRPELELEEPKTTTEQINLDDIPF